MTSFYDWYADLPVASPQVFGDQTDVPESGDWWNATYLLMWGSNVPVTRTPDAHWMAEARYKGQKVVVVSPDYADNTKFADNWLPAQPGTDGALAMAMGHVILKEFFVERRVPFFVDYVQRYTDLPFLVTLSRAGRRLRAGQVPHRRRPRRRRREGAALEDRAGRRPDRRAGGAERVDGVPLHRVGRGPVEPRPRRRRAPAHLLGAAGGEAAEVLLPRFDAARRHAAVCCAAGCRSAGSAGTARDHGLRPDARPVRRATRRVCPARWPTGYDDAERAVHPGLAAGDHLGAGRAGACGWPGRWRANAEESGGRTMIIMGAGICQWFHGDATYRAVLALLLLTGSMGRNGGGWAHYVGQEKCRPVTGWATMAMATDWQRPPRQMIGTAYWYTHTDQWRYDGYRADALTSPLAEGHLAGMHTIDTIALSARLGWMPSYPQFDRNPLDLADEVAASGGEVAEATSPGELRDGELHFAIEDPDAPQNWPRCLTLWRANLLGSSAKGDEYFLRHLLGTHHNLRAEQTPARPPAA